MSSTSWVISTISARASSISSSDVDARQLRGVEQGEQARERRPQLVRDRRREPDTQALVAARQVLRSHAITRSGR